MYTDIYFCKKQKNMAKFCHKILRIYRKHWAGKTGRMVAKLRKAHLRQCARKALEDKGYSVEDIGGAGVVPGARLRISKGSNSYTVAVRTSLERKVGLARNPEGGWVTVPSVDRVVVVTLSAEHPNYAEVLGFNWEAFIEVFDAELAARKKRKSDFSPKAPIFVTLDPSQSNPTKRALKGVSSWRSDVPLASVLSQQSSRVTAFADRVKREFAQLVDAEEEDVSVEFRIKR
jgi:hypothetical protein